MPVPETFMMKKPPVPPKKEPLMLLFRLVAISRESSAQRNAPSVNDHESPLSSTTRTSPGWPGAKRIRPDPPSAVACCMKNDSPVVAARASDFRTPPLALPVRAMVSSIAAIAPPSAITVSPWASWAEMKGSVVP